MLTQTQSKFKPAVSAAVNPAHSLARGLAGCWLLNEGAGTVARDIAGLHRDGSLSGSPVWSRGSFGATIDFDGDNDWITMGDCLDLGIDDVSVLAIVRYSAAAQPDQWSGQAIGAIAGKGYLDGVSKGYGLFVGAGNQIHWQIRDQGTEFAATSDAALNDGQWHLVVGVCDRDSSTGVRLYIDGVCQSSTANATNLNGVDLSGSRAFAVGSRQEESAGTWYWDFLGGIAMVCVWKRVLTEAEIRRLQHSPFELASSQCPLARLRPPASVASCSGSIHATTSARATARVVRSLAGAIHASTCVRGVLSVPGLVSLSGAMREDSALRGDLSCMSEPSPFQGMPQTQRAWQRDALFNGATGNAIKLGTTLTQGWFWMRRNGCTAVYRGRRLSRVDLSRILYVAEPRAAEISLPAYLPHPPGSTHCYLVRRFDGCGRQDETMSAAAMLRVSSNGRSAVLRPNAVFGLAGRQIGSTAVHWTWLYCPLDQETTPGQFNLYRADGAFAGTVRYQGRRFYSFDGEDLADIVVRSADVAGVEGRPSKSSIHPVTPTPHAQAVILMAEPV